MLILHRIRDIITEKRASASAPTFLPLEEQIDGWHRANQKMAWGIKAAEFEKMIFLMPPRFFAVIIGWGWVSGMWNAIIRCLVYRHCGFVPDRMPRCRFPSRLNRK